MIAAIDRRQLHARRRATRASPPTDSDSCSGGSRLSRRGRRWRKFRWSSNGLRKWSGSWTGH